MFHIFLLNSFRKTCFLMKNILLITADQVYIEMYKRPQKTIFAIKLFNQNLRTYENLEKKLISITQSIANLVHLTFKVN